MVEFVFYHTVIVCPVSIVGNLITLFGECLLGVIVKCSDYKCTASRYKLRRVEAQVSVALHIAHVCMVAQFYPVVNSLRHFIAYRLSLSKAASRESKSQCLCSNSMFYTSFHRLV